MDTSSGIAQIEAARAIRPNSLECGVDGMPRAWRQRGATGKQELEGGTNAWMRNPSEGGRGANRFLVKEVPRSHHGLDADLQIT